MNRYQDNLIRFFEEKELQYMEWTVEHDGNIHFIDSDFIKEVIINSTPQHEQKQIVETITMIDFKNGDINHFLEFLANAYIRMNY